MQHSVQLTYDQNHSLSWGKFVGSVLFAFFGAQIISGLFIGLPFMIYTASLSDKKQSPYTAHLEILEVLYYNCSFYYCLFLNTNL
ncbi:hypothetical protein SAMN04488574_10964 [Bacillus sp. 71mf]|nr:hypothetical protein SAMN04488574_10964 [Bacillus sp. 71mf]SFS54688.1 hypothetical protein SAMN04488145_1011162 [Bacillus sp. 103mf]